MNVVKIAVLSVGLSGILVLPGSPANTLSFLSSANNKAEMEKSGTSSKQDSPAAGITIAKKWEMPKVLTEISGLSYMNEQRFACVQDELGTVFIYNTESSSVEKEIPFAGSGDYEGLAVVGEDIWVLRADGKLFEVSGINEEKPAVKEHDTHLTIKQDSEGLCYDKKNNRLLIAIKGAELDTDDYKGIYAFDLGSKKMNQQPVFKIDLFDKIFHQDGSGKKKKATINPSGIALHPQMDDMYITDGRNPQLLVIDATGKIKSLYQLNNNEFAQPEGISFNAAGDLFISNEGTKQPGNILQVKINP
ncbi:MAG TPA: SdiA-regulated domain-containing protein [Chitinophagaceae bacterium]|nr:SdiA-regulated domain-containing protein [Chitinophagaceae bacterium]